MTISYSAIKLYQQCPLKYKIERIDKLKPLVPVDTSAADRGTMMHAMLETYLTTTEGALPAELQRMKPLLDKMRPVVRCEVQLALDAELQPCDYDSPTAVFRGIVDTIEDNDEEITIGDWKSGKQRDYSAQLEFYIMLAIPHYPKAKKFNSRIRYVDLMASTPGPTTQRKDLTRLWEQFNVLLNRINADRVFAPCPSGLCAFCPWAKKRQGLCRF